MIAAQNLVELVGGRQTEVGLLRASDERQACGIDLLAFGLGFAPHDLGTEFTLAGIRNLLRQHQRRGWRWGPRPGRRQGMALPQRRTRSRSSDREARALVADAAAPPRTAPAPRPLPGVT